MTNYMVDDCHYPNSEYHITDSSGDDVLVLKRSSRAQAEAVRDALEVASLEGLNAAQAEGFDHGYSVGHREATEEALERGYAQGRADYHEELWERGTDSERRLPETTEILDMARDFLMERASDVAS